MVWRHEKAGARSATPQERRLSIVRDRITRHVDSLSFRRSYSLHAALTQQPPTPYLKKKAKIDLSAITND